MTSTNDRQDQIGSLYRATRQETSPPHLDRAILAAARRAVRRRRFRWVVPASSAALVLLGLSLSYRFLEDLARLEAPEALAPARLDEALAPRQTDGRARQRPLESAAKAAPAAASDALQPPARSPATRATQGLPSAPETRRPPVLAKPEAQLRYSVPQPSRSRQMEAEEASPGRSADEWLLQIRAYKEAGDLGAARNLLREFLQQFPEAETPQDLRGLLSNP
jgi:hypothetical protein